MSNELTLIESTELQQHSELNIQEAINEWALNYQSVTARGKVSTAKEIGEALKAIRDNKLYRGGFSDFYIYCARRWGMKPNTVNSYIDATKRPSDASTQKTERALPETENGRYVYFIEGAGLIKIGVADDVQKRFGAIRTMSPVPLTLIGFVEGNQKLELELHKKFAKYRKHGEWFLDCSAIRNYMTEVLK